MKPDPGSNGRLRVLFVCSRNQWRSPTAEHLYRDDARLEVRSAGIRSEARRRVSAADIVLVMDRQQRGWIREHFRFLDLPEIRILDVPDEFEYMDPRLQAALRAAVDPEIDALLNRAGFDPGNPGEPGSNPGS
jgi:predicted protein tyrosine phosphatase